MIELSRWQFFPVVSGLQRIIEYAEDPRKYIESKRGKEFVDANPDLLSLFESAITERDVYGNGKHLQAFEAHLARLMNKKHGLFFITGIQAQTIALKVHCEAAGRPLAAFHHRSHLECHEQFSYKALFGLNALLLGESYFELPTVNDVRTMCQLPLKERPAVLLLELPNRELGCVTWTFQDLQEISSLCRSADVKLHMDGARLWEIEPYYQETAGKTFKDLADLFDTVYVSFYKGIGGITGAMLFCDEESFLHQSKNWQRRCGGNAYTLSTEAIDCERGFNENIGTFADKRRKMIEVVEAITKATSLYHAPGTAEPIVSFVPKHAVCNHIHTHFKGFSGDELRAARDRVMEQHDIKVFSGFRPSATKEDIDEQKNDAGDYGNSTSKPAVVDRKLFDFEWQISQADKVTEPTETWVKGWNAFCEALVQPKSNVHA